MSENHEFQILSSDSQLASEDEDILYMQTYLYNITARITPPFFERKLQKGVADTIEEEIEELYSEIFELDAYIKSLVNTNAVLLNNYEEKTREIYDKRTRLSEKFQILKEELQQVKKDLNEMQVMKDKLNNRNESLSDQIKKMEQMYNKTSKQYDNLNEEILTMTMSDYQDKLYQLKEEMSLNSDLISNLKYEYNEYKLMTNIVKQKNLKKEKKKILLKNKLIKYDEKLKNLLDKEKNELNIHDHMIHHLEFLKKTHKNLKDINQRKEEERKSLNLMIEYHLSSKPGNVQKSEDNENDAELMENFERKPVDFSFRSPEEKLEMNFENLEKEFNEMNIKENAFCPMNADQFALYSHRNTRINSNANQFFVGMTAQVQKIDRIEEKDKIEEIPNNSKVSKKKKKQNPDRVYIETIKFFLKHKYKILFVCLLFPMLRYNYA